MEENNSNTEGTLWISRENGMGEYYKMMDLRLIKNVQNLVGMGIFIA